MLEEASRYDGTAVRAAAFIVMGHYDKISSVLSVGRNGSGARK